MPTIEHFMPYALRNQSSAGQYRLVAAMGQLQVALVRSSRRKIISVNNSYALSQVILISYSDYADFQVWNKH